MLSASSTSADPDLEDTDRLPHLTIFTPPSGCDKGRRGGHVNGIGAIAASSCGVHEACAVDGKWSSGGEECVGGTGDVGVGFAAGADGSEQRCDVDVVVVADGEWCEYFNGLFDGGVWVVEVGDEVVECFVACHGCGLSYLFG